MYDVCAGTPFPPGREPAALITQLQVLLSAKGLPGQANAAGAVPVNAKALVERAMGPPVSRSRSSSAAGAARLYTCCGSTQQLDI
jgi:hypothetical protein